MARLIHGGRWILFRALLLGGTLVVAANASALPQARDSVVDRSRQEAERLCDAARDNDLVTIRACLASGVGVDARFQGKTPLMWAAGWGSIEAMHVLLDAGADVSAVDRAGRSVVRHAVGGCEAEALRRLLSAGAAPNPDNLRELLARAIVCPSSDVFELATRFVPEQFHGKQLLHAAAWYGNLVAAEFLLEHGVAVDERDEMGCTPLHAACAAGQTRMARFLLEAGASADDRDELGRTPLHVASEEGHAHLSAELSARMRVADVPNCAADYFGRTPAHRAAALGHREALAVALRFCEPRMLNLDTGAGATPLALAARSGSRACYDLLRSYGAQDRFEEPLGIDPAEWMRLRRGDLRASEITPMYRPPYPLRPAILIEYHGPSAVRIDGRPVHRVRVGRNGIVLSCRATADGSTEAIAGRLPLERLELYHEQIVGTGLFHLPQHSYGGSGHMGNSRDELTVVIGGTRVSRFGSGLVEARDWSWFGHCGRAARRNMWIEVGDLLVCLVNDASAMPVPVESEERDFCSKPTYWR